MNRSELAALAVVLTAICAVTAFAAPRCSNGAAPQLSGDAFAPVVCSSATKPAPPLPGAPVAAVPKADLRDLEGRWEGNVAHALGRYNIGLTVKTSWGGKTRVTLDLLEMQFRERLTDSLALAPAKEPGTYSATMTTSLAPEAALAGTLRLGLEPVAPSSATVVAASRQADLVLANGASHRIVFAFTDKDTLDVATASAVPGAPPMRLRVALSRAKSRR